MKHLRSADTTNLLAALDDWVVASRAHHGGLPVCLQPLVSHDVIIALIAHTTTRAGLKIRAELDPAHYPTGTKVTAVSRPKRNTRVIELNRRVDENWPMFERTPAAA